MKLPTVAGVAVTLRVNGQDLAELYDPDEEATEEQANTVVRYVEAVAGAEFSVHLETTLESTHRAFEIAMSVILDGTCVDKVLFPAEPKAIHPRAKTCDSAKSFVNGQWQKRRFAFTELETTDGATQGGSRLDLKKQLANIGEITIELRSCITLGIRDHRSWANETQLPVTSSIPEKALKGRAVSNHVTLRAPEACENSSRVEVTYPLGYQPFAIFKFKYRSHRDLQVEGIIARTPSPLPLEERDPDSLTPEELREVVRRQREHLREATVVKKEKRERPELIDEDDDETDTGELRGRKRQRTSQDSGVVIDLTDD